MKKPSDQANHKKFPLHFICTSFFLYVQYVRKKSTPYNSLVSNRVIKTR